MKSLQHAEHFIDAAIDVVPPLGGRDVVEFGADGVERGQQFVQPAIDEVEPLHGVLTRRRVRALLASDDFVDSMLERLGTIPRPGFPQSFLVRRAGGGFVLSGSTGSGMAFHYGATSGAASNAAVQKRSMRSTPRLRRMGRKKLPHLNLPDGAS